MSVQAMSWVIEHSPHRMPELLVLLMVANHANAEGREAWPSVARLARCCRLSERQVLRLLKRLEDAGALRIEHGRGRGHHNSYAVVMDDRCRKGDTRDTYSEKVTSATPFPAEKVTSRAEKVTSRARKGDIAPEKAQEEPSLEPSLELPLSLRRVGAGADAPAPPTPRGNAKVSALIDALRAEGMTGRLTPRDAKAVKDTEHDPQEVAALYAAIYRGEYGDTFLKTNLSISLCLERLPGWRSHLAGNRAPPKTTGRLSGQDYLAWRRQQVQAELNGTGGTGGHAEGLRRLPGGAVDADYRPLPPDRAR